MRFYIGLVISGIALGAYTKSSELGWMVIGVGLIISEIFKFLLNYLKGGNNE